MKIAKQLPADAERDLLAAIESAYQAKLAGDMAKAEAGYAKAWEMLPEPKPDWSYSMVAASALAEFLTESGQYEKAIRFVPELLATNTNGYAAHNHFGWASVSGSGQEGGGRQTFQPGLCHGQGAGFFGRE